MAIEPTKLPKALQTQRDAMIASAQSAAPAAPATPPTNQAPQMQPLAVQTAPAPQAVIQPAPAAQAQPAPAPAQSDSAQIDLSNFIVEDAPAQPAPVAQPQAQPAPVVQPQAQPAPAAQPAPQLPWQQPQVQPQAQPAPTADTEVAKLRGQVEALQSIVAAGGQVTNADQSAQAAAERMLNIDVADLTPEEQQTYAGSIPVIQKLIDKALANQVDPVLTQLNQRTVDPSVITDIRESVARTGATTFDSTMHAVIPDLDALSQHPSFQAYADQTIPNTGGRLTVRAMLAQAYKSQDIAALKGHMDEFRGMVSQAPAQQVAPAAALHAPTMTQAQPQMNPTGAIAAEKPTLAWSKRNEASVAFRRGQITREQLSQVDQLYNEALAEGRVAMDK